MRIACAVVLRLPPACLVTLFNYSLTLLVAASTHSSQKVDLDSSATGVLESLSKRAVDVEMVNSVCVESAVFAHRLRAKKTESADQIASPPSLLRSHARMVHWKMLLCKRDEWEIVWCTKWLF